MFMHFLLLPQLLKYPATNKHTVQRELVSLQTSHKFFCYLYGKVSLKSQ